MLALEPELGGPSEPAQQETENELEQAYAEFRDQVRFWIQRVAVPSIMVIGLFGNSITMIIMTRRRMRSTTNLYLAALAFVDMLYLVLTFLLGLSHYPNMAGYKYYIYWRLRPFLIMFTDACSNTSVWLIVTFTIERYIAVKYPMKGKVWCTEARAKMLIMCVFLFGTLFASPVPFEWNVIEKKVNQKHVEQHSLGPIDSLKNPSDKIALNYGDATTNLTINADVDASNNSRSKLNGTTICSVSRDDSCTLALDYTDFGRNETYKTYYYALTAVIFYFVPLFSLMLFNGFLIKSVHHSKRERTKMTRRPSCQQLATACNANSNSSNNQPATSNSKAFPLAAGLEHIDPISIGKTNDFETATSPKQQATDGAASKFLKDGQIRLKLLLDSVRPAPNSSKGANSSLASSAKVLPESSLNKCEQDSPLIAKQEQEATALQANSSCDSKHMSSPENLYTQSSQLAIANDGLTSSNSSNSKAIVDLDDEFNHQAGTQDVRINNNYNCDINESSAHHNHPELIEAAELGNQEGFSLVANRLMNNNNEIHTGSDSTKPVVSATGELSSIQRPQAQTLVGIVENNSSKNVPRGEGSSSNNNINKTIEGLSLAPPAHHHRYMSSKIDLPSSTKRSPNASASSQQAIVPQASSTQERRITIMLIAVVILFLVCQIPSAALLLYTSVRDIKPNTNEHALVLAFGNIFNFLMAVNAAGNFILYSFLSKKYRRTFVLLFCGCLGTTTRGGSAQHKHISSNCKQSNRMISVRFDPPTSQAPTSSASSYQHQNNNNKSSDSKTCMDTLV